MGVKDRHDASIQQQLLLRDKADDDASKFEPAAALQVRPETIGAIGTIHDGDRWNEMHRLESRPGSRD